MTGDRLVAVVFVVAAVVEALVRHHGRPVLLAGDLAGAFALASLAARRTRPLLPVTVIALVDGLGSLVQALVPATAAGPADVVVPILALIFANYSLGVYGGRRQVVVGGALTLGLVTVVDLADPAGGHSLASALPFFGLFVVVAPVLAGRLVRGRGALVARLEEQTRRLEGSRDTAAVAARARERMQLADRLQRHLVSGMEVLVADARADPGTPDRLETLAARLEAQARALLAETRGVVVALAEAPPAEGPPAPARRTVPSDRADAVPWTALAAAALGAGLVLEVVAGSPRVPLPVAAVAALLLAAPVAVLWARPLLVTALLWLLAAAFSVTVMPLAPLLAGAGVCVLAPFLVAALSDRLRAVAGLVLCLAGAALAFGPREALSDSGLLLLAWLAGCVLHERLRLVEALRQTHLLLTEQVEQLHRAAVYDERARVARELHDAVGHSLTVIALQAGGARRLAAGDPARAAQALGTLGRVAEDGLHELRHGFEVPLGGRAGTLEDLVAGARDAGLDVRLDTDGPDDALAPEARTAVYRVVQEALTNVLRHAPGSRAEVTCRRAGDRYEVVVVNDAPPEPLGPTAGSGHGLPGMRSRVEACGGALTWSALPGGGFEVRAELPLTQVPA